MNEDKKRFERQAEDPETLMHSGPNGSEQKDEPLVSEFEEDAGTRRTIESTMDGIARSPGQNVLFGNLSLKARLMAGFGSVLTVFLLAVLFVLGPIWETKTVIHRLVNVRMTTVYADERLVKGLLRSIAELRGYVLLGKISLGSGEKRRGRTRSNLPCVSWRSFLKIGRNRKMWKKFRK